MAVARFSGTVVDCRTRFSVEKPTKALLTHFDANWILTIAIDAADPGLPFEAGTEKAFAIHSPVQLLFDAAEECVGKHYDFCVELDETRGRPDWITFARARSR